MCNMLQRRNFTSQLISKHNNAQIDVHIKVVNKHVNCERQRKSPIDEHRT